MLFGFCVDNGTPPRSECGVDPRNASEEYYDRTGIRAARIFAGSSTADAVTGLTLVTSGSVLVDQPVVDTLQDYEDSPLWSHAYAITADPGYLEEPTLGDVIFGTSSLLLHVTLYPTFVPPVATLAHAVGNFDGSSGVSLLLDENDHVRLKITPLGGTPVDLTRDPGVATSNLWDDWVVVVDRAAGVVRFGDIRGETTSSLDSGSLGSTAKFRVGTTSTDQALLGQYMRILVAYGQEVEGKSARQLAELAASGAWWSPTYTRVTEVAR